MIAGDTLPINLPGFLSRAPDLFSLSVKIEILMPNALLTFRLLRTSTFSVEESASHHIAPNRFAFAQLRAENVKKHAQRHSEHTRDRENRES